MIEFDRSVALVGAGISVGAGLPTAYALFDALVDSLVHREWARTELKRLARPDRSDPHDVIRFETLLLWVQDVFDDDLELFEFLDSYRTPSTLHLQFAQAAIRGMLVVTTNFDDLLEQAVDFRAGVSRTVDAHSTPADLLDVPIIKLHGTREVHRDGRVARSGRPLHATTEVIAAANPGNLMNRTASDLLLSCIADRHLIVAGYSASDDLDVVPALESARPSRVTWIDHAAGATEHLGLEDLKAEETSWLGLLRHWENQGTAVEVWRGPTDDVAHMLGLSRTGIPAASGVVRTWDKTVKSWARRVRSQDPTGLGFAGLLFGEMQRYEFAERALRESRGSRTDPNKGWTSARRRYEIAQTVLLRDGSDPLEARRLAKRARLEAIRTGDEQSALFSELLLGRAAFLLHDWTSAAAAFEASAARADSAGHRAYAQSWLGRTYVWAGNPKKAGAPLRAAVRSMRREGNLEGLLDALDGLGLAGFLLGRLDVARTHLAEAMTIADRLGFADRTFTLDISLADISFIAGDLGDAQRRLDSAFGLDQEGNDEMSVAWALQADLLYERNQLDEALDAARKAQVTTSVITRSELGGIDALEADILLRMGDVPEARKAAARSLARPVEEATWSARLHARVVLSQCDGADPDAMREALRNYPRPMTVPTLIRTAAILRRYGITTPGARALVRRANVYVTRAGIPYWASRLSPI